MCESRGEGGGAGGTNFLGPYFMENHKASKPAFNAGPLSARQRNAI